MSHHRLDGRSTTLAILYKLAATSWTLRRTHASLPEEVSHPRAQLTRWIEEITRIIAGLSEDDNTLLARIGVERVDLYVNALCASCDRLDVRVHSLGYHPTAFDSQAKRINFYLGLLDNLGHAQPGAPSEGITAAVKAFEELDIASKEVVPDKRGWIFQLRRKIEGESFLLQQLRVLADHGHIPPELEATFSSPTATLPRISQELRRWQGSLAWQRPDWFEDVPGAFGELHNAVNAIVLSAEERALARLESVYFPRSRRLLATRLEERVHERS